MLIKHKSQTCFVVSHHETTKLQIISKYHKKISEKNQGKDRQINTYIESNGS